MEILFKWAMGLSIFFATLQMLSETNQVDCEVETVACTKPVLETSKVIPHKESKNLTSDSLRVYNKRLQ